MRLLCCCMLVMAVFLTGCASKIPSIDAKHYPQCKRPLDELAESDRAVTKKTAASAIGGALLGAISGLVTTGKVAGAIGGAAIGAVAGGAIGYTFAKAKQLKEEEGRFSVIRDIAIRDVDRFSRQQMYAYESLLCYISEFETLNGRYKSGKMNIIDFKERFSEIHAAMNVLGTFIGGMESEIEKTRGEFFDSLSASAPKNSGMKKKKKDVGKKGRGRKTQNLMRTAQLRKEKIQKLNEKNRKEQNRFAEEAKKMQEHPAHAARAIQPDRKKVEAGYGERYLACQDSAVELRETHVAALKIMNDAAREAGIDMI